MSNLITGPLLQEYIGSKSNSNTNFFAVPNNKRVTIHFVLSFATDYDANDDPTNGNFKIYWKESIFTPEKVREIKQKNSNVKVILGVGSRDGKFPFTTTSHTDSWVDNAAFSLGNIINQYYLDGIEVNYEHINPASVADFALCVGGLIKTLKERRVITFASIAPNSKFQSSYSALYNNYKQYIDLVSYQFYTHSLGSEDEFVNLYFDIRNNKFRAANLLAGFSTASQDAINLPAHIFFPGCQKLKGQGNFGVGIFIWSAEDSDPNYEQEKNAQNLLGSP